MDVAVISSSHGALGPLVGKLTTLLADECGRLKGVRREIRCLRSELTSMHAVLKEYTKLEDPNDQTTTWISLVRELAYDTEDVFDKFINHLGNDGHHGGFKEFFRKTARCLKILGARRGLTNKIDDLKARIKQVKELKVSYMLDDTLHSSSGHATVDPRLNAFFAEKSHLVGIDGPRDDLAKWMVEDGYNLSKHRKVLSIVGFGGLGKTTLANEVHHKIQGHFDCRAFVSISQEPDIKKFIKDVTSQCQHGSTIDTHDWDERKFIANLRKLLHDKRYLIIIDDLWSASAWDAIKYAFPENKFSSRIIVTTRIVDVATSCCMGGDNRMYKMEALSDCHSRTLFFKRIFGSEFDYPDTLKEVSNEMLKKCGGLPLAIINISSLLANKPAIKEEWEKVRRSIGSAMKTRESLEGMSSILSLSYNDLQPNLKTCLLYLSAFPEDYVIERERLVRRWIAEGFISEERGLNQQEVAEKHFYELINRSMVQAVDIGYDGKVRACRVHDMMLEIIISKSATENFITVVGGGQSSLTNSHGFNIRRLSVQHMDQELAILENEDLSHVRSLTVTSSSSGCIKHLPSLVGFEASRVLDFEACNGMKEYNMNNIDKLLQLKYIGLRNTGISELPSGIVMLRYLETLDFRNTYVQELPVGIVRLTKIEHLLAAGETKIPNGIGNLRKLRVISGFSITWSPANAVEELGNLTNLNELDVDFYGGGSDEYKRHEVMLLSSLCRLGRCKLQSLQISRYGGSFEFLDTWSPLPFSLKKFHMTSNNYFTSVPMWIAPALTNLAYLGINLTELTEEGLRTIGELPALLCLELALQIAPHDKVTVQGIGFPSLKKFVLFSRAGTYVTFVKGAMPKLENLSLLFNVPVAKTHGFYLGIKHLTCLKQVDTWLRNEGVTSSDRKVAASALRNEAGAHPNHPTITFEGEY